MSPKEPDDFEEIGDDAEDMGEEGGEDELEADDFDYIVLFFEDTPRIDIDRLTQFIKASDPNEAPLKLEPGSDVELEEDGQKVSTFSLTVDDYELIFFVRPAPWSEREAFLEAPQIADEDKQAVSRHRAHLEINAFGGAEFPPYERMVLLIKAAVAVCEQGAIGAFNPAAGIYYSAEAVANLIEMNREAIAGEEATLWETLRDEGQPARLLMNIELIGLEDHIFLLTRGLDTCGLPDFIAELSEDAGEEEIHDLMEFMETAFAYLISNDMMIEPGAIIVFEDDAQYQFSEAPDWIADEFPYNQILLVEQVEDEEGGEGEEE